MKTINLRVNKAKKNKIKRKFSFTPKCIRKLNQLVRVEEKILERYKKKFNLPLYDMYSGKKMKISTNLKIIKEYNQTTGDVIHTKYILYVTVDRYTYRCDRHGNDRR